MRGWVFLHVLSACAWAGCVMTELVAEKWLARPGDRVGALDQGERVDPGRGGDDPALHGVFPTVARP